MRRPSSPNRYPKRADAKPGRVDLNLDEVDNLIADQGVRIRIIPSVLCPNRTAIEDTNHALGCDVCKGDEVVDLVDQCFETDALIYSIKLDKQFNPQGVWDVKDAMLTTKAEVRLSYWYKIEVIDHASIYNEVIKKGSGDSDKTRYKIPQSCDTPFHLIDKAGVQYLNGTDFRPEDQAIKWLGSNRPASGTLFSLHYPIIPTYRVLETLHDNRFYMETFKRKERVPFNLPQQAVLRWDYLANKSGSRELVTE